MRIKAIGIDDYEKLISFWEDNYFVSEMDNRERFIQFLEKNPGLSILAEENGTIIGTALGSYDGRRGYIQKVVVKKSMRKSGIGAQLLNEVIKKLQNAGAVYIPISVEKEVIPFYEKCGFIKKNSQAMSRDL